VQQGYELVREQLFFRKELIERLPWLIRLRWIAVGATCFGCIIYYLFWQTLPPAPLVILLIGVFGYNLLVQFFWKRLSRPKQPDIPLPTTPSDRQSRIPISLTPYHILAHTQISADLLTLCLAIYFSGGISSPLTSFTIFHVILTGILLPPSSCYLYGSLVLAALGFLVFLEHETLLPAWPTLFQNILHAHDVQSAEILVRYAALCAAILITAYLVTTLKLSLRAKGRELLHLSRELDASNTKLTALYEMVKDMGECTDPGTLMDMATRLAAHIMGVKACSIKLLDDQQKMLYFTSSYGLSDDFIKSTESIDIQKSLINRKIIEGSVYSVGHIDEKDYFQYPEDIRKEGIASMICLPLQVAKQVLGVFCVYSSTSHYFMDEDVSFLARMADLTALEIQKQKAQSNRIRFLQKAVHQLRSPMHAVISMLKILKNRYIGPLNDPQNEMIQRCENRLELLDAVIMDLLNFSIRRDMMSQESLQPVDTAYVLQGLSSLVQNQAMERNISIHFQIDASLPTVMATKRMIDDLFSNLISNAIKYTPAGGQVKVSLIPDTDKENHIRFTVTDTGIGIPEDAFLHLFTEFFRTENAKAFTESGTGLGLVIVKEILDRLKGTISVSSQVEKGTTFVCDIPTG
jgi:nitrogen-specific signal transduction histidine kinase